MGDRSGPDDEKGRMDVVLAEHGEDLRRPCGIGPVVERQREGAVARARRARVIRPRVDHRAAVRDGGRYVGGAPGGGNRVVSDPGQVLRVSLNEQGDAECEHHPGEHHPMRPDRAALPRATRLCGHGFCGAGGRLACPGAVALRPEVDPGPGVCVEVGEPCVAGAGVETVVPPGAGEAGATRETGDGSAGGASCGAGDGGFGLDGRGDRVTAGC